jgi:hypothetical protein
MLRLDLLSRKLLSGLVALGFKAGIKNHLFESLIEVFVLSTSSWACRNILPITVGQSPLGRGRGRPEIIILFGSVSICSKSRSRRLVAVQPARYRWIVVRHPSRWPISLPIRMFQSSREFIMDPWPACLFLVFIYHPGEGRLVAENAIQSRRSSRLVAGTGLISVFRSYLSRERLPGNSIAVSTERSIAVIYRYSTYNSAPILTSQRSPGAR